MKRIVLLACLLIGIQTLAMAQDWDTLPVPSGIRITPALPAQKIDSWSAAFHAGFIIPHSAELRPISNTTPLGFQLEWGRIRLSKKAWQSCNCLAKTGFVFSYFGYGNPEVLGSAVSVLYFAQPYLLGNPERRHALSLRASAGLTYLTQVYDEQTNPLNTFYSSPLSFTLLVSLNYHLRLSRHWSLTAAGYYNHISNGGMSLPNRGMNFPTASLGLTHTPKPKSINAFPSTDERKGSKDWFVSAFGSVSLAEATDSEPESYQPIFGLAGGGMYFLSQTNALQLMGEITYNGSYSLRSQRQGRNDPPWLAGLLIGHNLSIGRFSFAQMVGYYLYRPFPANQHDFYQRYLLLYRFGSHWQVGTSLKAHLQVAEYFDLRVGFSW